MALFFLFILVAFIFLPFVIYKTVILSNWHYPLPEMQISSQEFYDTVETILKEREVPDITVSRVEHAEFISALFFKRQYLHVTRGEYVFDICAAPFGTGFFFSWWQQQSTSYGKLFFARIPIIGALIGRKTFYQMDTEAMYKGSVHQAVLKAIDIHTSGKGVRGMTELERRPVDMFKIK